MQNAYSRPNKLLAEFLGTFGLVLFSTGAICADQALRMSGQVSLGLLGTALAYGLAAGGLFGAVGNISGGHFNPALTIGFWVTRKFGTFDALTYCIAQLAGAATASYTLRYAVPDQIWGAVALGTPGTAVTRAPAMLIEAALTFFLAMAVFAASTNRSTAAVSAPTVGFVVAAGAILAGPFTGAAMNPARAFGPALAAHHWTNQGVYWVGPLAGAMLGATVCDLFFRGVSGD